MKPSIFTRVAAAALALFAYAGLALPASAAITDYEFQLVKTEVKKEDAGTFSVRLVDKRTGALVPDAVIFEQRIDMAPDGMEMMDAPIEPPTSTEPGIYSFKAAPSMAGGWRLSLSAKVQGEEGTLESNLVFKVLP